MDYLSEIIIIIFITDSASRMGIKIISSPNHTVALRLTKPLTEMSTRNLPGG
jgi:hypothetical protein